GEARHAVRFAIDAGYRHFDFACVYQNEWGIGESLQQLMCSVLPLQLWCTFYEKTLLKEACQKTLVAFQLGYLNLYLMHWLLGFKEGEELFPADENGMIIPSDMD
ncbi:AKCL2 reductase, partial [Crypturellus undulatus]|nr:AKCL2 reductase [Crypturellus undulatus]